MDSHAKQASEAQNARIETAEYAAMMRRMLRGWVRRVAEADEADLAEMAAFLPLVSRALDDVVAEWREQDRSWSTIARPFGITRQAAQQHWGDHAPAP